ncbi:hypothetical protein [Streptomyces sp. CAU 1734]|uniref:hypothetical protein n=1 Tax=Streptomyces sp. CAU 1734 TaxID=3140360 RepID=UPI0032603103
MVMMTGPQTDPDDVGTLMECVGLFGAHLFTDDQADWTAVTAVYVLPGWESCPLAVADISIALAAGLTIHHIQR